MKYLSTEIFLLGWVIRKPHADLSSSFPGHFIPLVFCQYSLYTISQCEVSFKGKYTLYEMMKHSKSGIFGGFPTLFWVCTCHCSFPVNLTVKICLYRKGNLNYFLSSFLYVIIWNFSIHLSVYNLRYWNNFRKSLEREDFEKIMADQAIAAGNRIKYMQLGNNYTYRTNVLPVNKDFLFLENIYLEN